jgi:SAM-dependent methyltransferase
VDEFNPGKINMHPAQQEFTAKLKALFPDKFKNVSVLDVGSLDINGNNRYLFEDFEYTGIDIGPGPNVDVVCSGHEFNPGKQYDVVISTECMEHNKNWWFTVYNMVSLLKPGGLLIMTMAGQYRPEHGTKNTSPVASPYTHDYYRNIRIADLSKALAWEYFFFPIAIEYGGAHDLYVYGIKK